ncbi:MAG: NarK/NasA family nitrate transporter [Nitrospirae bacterium]|nr:MAG: NarK/NasA family nitrate transporter [Nitrospirota bacterium]
MSLQAALRSGHWPSLLAAWLHFEVSFMTWMLIGALGIFIAEDFSLTATEKGLMVAVPLLGGSLFRVVVGILSDRFGPRRTGFVTMLAMSIPLMWAWLVATTFPQILGVGLLLGIAGASFAVSLPLASRAYPLQHQGLAMGVAGSGNSGAIVSIALAPLLAVRFGWHAVFGMMIPLVFLIACLYRMLASDRIAEEGGSDHRMDFSRMLHEPDTYWFCLLYAITFGGFVGLSSYLSIFFFDQYGLTHIEAGWTAAACALAGSLFRPVGGFIADRLGGLRVLAVLYPVIAVLIGITAMLLPLSFALSTVFLAMMCLGMGNGVIFQVVPQRFRREIGAISGLVGAAGGIGGFLVPSALGVFRDLTGTYATGFAMFAVACILIVPVMALFWRPVHSRHSL